MLSQSFLYQEIHQQPSVLANLFEVERANIRRIADEINARHITNVFVAARGTSDNAARYAQYVLGAHNRLGVGLAVPSLYTLYGAPPKMGRALTIGISQSGQSPDVVSVLEEARKQGGATLAITNDTGSPLAAAADVTLALSTGAEPRAKGSSSAPGHNPSARSPLWGSIRTVSIPSGRGGASGSAPSAAIISPHSGSAAAAPDRFAARLSS